MWDWIVRNWQHEWLGSFAWWQAVAGLSQAILAFFLYRVTRDLAGLGLFQSRLQKQSLKIALFQRRLDTFLSLMSFLAKGSPEIPSAIQFLRETNTAEFLFGPEIDAFIQRVYSDAIKIHRLETSLISEHDDRRRDALVNELTPLQLWFSSTAFAEAKELFRSYLAFGNQDWEEPPFLTLGEESWGRRVLRRVWHSFR